jgi:hypothetical protein
VTSAGWRRLSGQPTFVLLPLANEDSMAKLSPLWTAKAAVTAGIISAGCSAPALPVESDVPITIYVYNVAQVASRMLRSVEGSAATIFGKAGMITTWFDVRASVPEDLEVGSRGDPMMNEVQMDQGVLGFVPRFDGNSVAVLYDRVQVLASLKRADAAAIVGIATAHEIGHLLLRSSGHSSEGIMTLNWPSTDRQGPAQARLRFTGDQSQRMRDEVFKWNPQPPETALKIEVDIYNYSAISAEILARAEGETASIFQRIGVATAWLVCPLNSEEAVRNRTCALPGGPTRLTLRLLSNSMANALQVGSDIFGSARQPQNEAFGVVADVYADRTRELAHGHEFEVVLGRVIAHELGHLLLGKNAHSAAGIMHTPWRARDLESTREAAMSFLPGEAKRIRAQVLVRMSSGSTR